MANKFECNATGSGIYKQCALSPLEESVANMLQFEKQLNPEGAVQGVDCPASNTEFDDIIEAAFPSEIEGIIVADEVSEMPLPPQAQEVPTTSKKAIRRKGSSSVMKNQRPSHRNILLQKHTDKQSELLTDISNTLGSVKRSLRDANQYQKKLLQIEERKLKLLEIKNQREEENHQSLMKINHIKVLIKERELQLLN